MTEKKPSPYAKNFSPMRVEIAAFINNHKRTTTEVAAQFEGYSRERMANILRGMAESKMVSRETTPEGRILWFKYKAPAKQKEREMPCLNGTMREKLSTSWMTQPARAGATDAFNIRSVGF
jgi:hypothetical protein